MKYLSIAAILCLSVSSAVPDEKAAHQQLWNLETLHKPPKHRWLDSESPIRSLVYANEPFEGRPTEVFVFYATPGTLAGDASLDTDLPAVVLIHGGGGTAFAEWVNLWAKRGYAAIAMDLSGRRPAAPKFNDAGELIVERGKDKLNPQRLSNGGPEADHIAKFKNVGGDLTDDWQYHAVPAVIRAQSLIRSFPEVDEQKTAVTGISWGGYMTCLVASIDDRFKAAVPVYGCGFLYSGESVQRRQIDALPAAQRAEWLRLWEPSVWLPHCEVPIFFVNGTNDIHYPLRSYRKSYELIQGEKQLRILPGMRHSHIHGWQPTEIGRFIDAKLLGKDPLPVVGEPMVDAGNVTASYKSSQPLKSATLHYTLDAGRLAERTWKSRPAIINENEVHATVPPEATICLFTLEDHLGDIVSSGVMFAE